MRSALFIRVAQSGDDPKDKGNPNIFSIIENSPTINPKGDINGNFRNANINSIKFIKHIIFFLLDKFHIL